MMGSAQATSCSCLGRSLPLGRGDIFLLVIVATVLGVHVFPKYMAVDTLIFASVPDPAQGHGHGVWQSSAPLARSTSDAFPFFLSPCTLYSHSQRSCRSTAEGESSRSGSSQRPLTVRFTSLHHVLSQGGFFVCRFMPLGQTQSESSGAREPPPKETRPNRALLARTSGMQRP